MYFALAGIGLIVMLGFGILVKDGDNVEDVIRLSGMYILMFLTVSSCAFITQLRRIEKQAGPQEKSDLSDSPE